MLSWLFVVVISQFPLANKGREACIWISWPAGSLGFLLVGPLLGIAVGLQRRTINTMRRQVGSLFLRSTASSLGVFPSSLRCTYATGIHHFLLSASFNAAFFSFFRGTVPKDLRYSKSHEWIRVEGNVGTVGVTDHAQEALGEVVFVDLPETGSVLKKGESFGAVESVKTASDLYLPAGGEVVEVNKVGLSLVVFELAAN